MNARKDDHPAIGSIRGLLHVIDTAKGKPTPGMLIDIRSMALDALMLLQEPDPRMQRIGTVMLVLRQCTEVRSKMVNGRLMESVTIVDQVGYKWAMGEVHKLGTL